MKRVLALLHFSKYGMKIMFELLKSPSRSAAGAISYVTVGTLMVIWAGLWYFFFLFPVPNPPSVQTFVCAGAVLSGLAIVAIGLMFGMIGREAKAADNAVGVAPVAPVTPLVTAAVASPAIQMPVATRPDNPIVQKSLAQNASR